MKSNRLRAFMIVLLVAIALGCDRDDPTPPYVINNSIIPVDFLMDNVYKTLTLEIAWVEGNEPSTSSVNYLVNFLSARINKPGGIKITERVVPSVGKQTITIEAIRDYERANRTSVASGSNLTLWIVMLDAEYSESTQSQKVLGVSYGASSLALFEPSLSSFTADGSLARNTLEKFVLSHEVGHVLGLVNNRTPMITPHQDTDHGAHCSNTKCLMYWQAQLNIDFAVQAVPTLDDNCLADLRAKGGK